MTSFSLREGITDRTVIQILPDTVEHQAVYACDDNEHNNHVYPVIGWACVVRIHPDGPCVVLEPIVDVEDTYGPIVSSDLEHEEGLVLLAVE